MPDFWPRDRQTDPAPIEHARPAPEPLAELRRALDAQTTAMERLRASVEAAAATVDSAAAHLDARLRRLETLLSPRPDEPEPPPEPDEQVRTIGQALRRNLLPTVFGGVVSLVVLAVTIYLFSRSGT